MNGCHNRQALKESFGKYALDSQTGKIRWFEVKNPNSKDCQYSKTSKDEKCNGCKWRNSNVQKAM
jgi:hypothetical protein